MTAVAVNENPASPLSTVRRGRRISQCISVDNIASQEELEKYAQLVCQKHMLLGETITISTTLIPCCGVNEVVSIVHPDTEGLCIETGWTMSLEPGGTMTHKLEKVVGING